MTDDSQPEGQCPVPPPMVPVAAVTGLLSAVHDALQDVYRGGDAAIERCAAVMVDACGLPMDFELNARYPSVRDEANLFAIKRATTAIRDLLARQPSQH